MDNSIDNTLQKDGRQLTDEDLTFLNSRHPDYMLSLISGKYSKGRTSENSFSIYIKKSEHISNNNLKVKGIAVGHNVRGSIEGTIGRNEMEFNITYLGDLPSDTPKKTVLIGKRFKDTSYTGNYKHILNGEEPAFEDDDRFCLKLFNYKTMVVIKYDSNQEYTVDRLKN